MKKTILPALAMLIVAAVMLSTASYAWFAMGATVSANNISVSVKSDSAYLVIFSEAQKGEAMTNGKIANGFTQQSVSFGSSSIYPVAYGHVQAMDGETSKVDAEGKPIYVPNLNLPASGGAFDFTADDVWYTMKGTDSANGTGVEGTLEFINDYEDLCANYVHHETVYVATSVGSKDMADLKTLVKIDGDDAVNVLVVTSTAYAYFKVTSSDYAEVVLAGTISNTPTQVDIYVFYNGNVGTITTDQFGLQKIDATSVNVSFKAE